MAQDIGRALVAAGAVSSEAMGLALLTAVQGRVSLVRALLATNAIDRGRLELELARLAPDAPIQKHPVPVADLLERLPPRLCESLLAMPVRRDPRTGTVDVALADANDEHAANEIAFFLGAEVRAVRSPVAALESALARMRSVVKMRAAATGSEPPAPLRGLPVFSLDEFRLDEAAQGRVAATLSERPTPHLAHAESASSRHDAADAEYAIPLSRRFAPLDDEGIVLSLTRPHHIPHGDDEPVVELRFGRPPTDPPNGTKATAPDDGAPAESSPIPLAQLLKEMNRLTERDPLGELVLLAARSVAPKTALFAVKKDAFAGWMCAPEFGERSAFADVRVALRAPSFLSAAAASGNYVGPLLRNESHAPLAPFFKSPRPEVIALTLRAANRPAVVLVAHEVGDPRRVVPVLAEIARVAGESLEKILMLARAGVASRR